MGMTINVYRNSASDTDCTAGGISSRVSSVCVVNVPGPFYPTVGEPAVVLIKGPQAGPNVNPILVDAEDYLSGVWTMFGGNFGHTSDSRWHDALKKMGAVGARAVSFHDRVEKRSVIAPPSLSTSSGAIDWILASYMEAAEFADDVWPSARFTEDARKVCHQFYWDFFEVIAKFESPRNQLAQCGHDLWLTRQRHGAGFWDRKSDCYGSDQTRDDFEAWAERLKPYDNFVTVRERLGGEAS